MENITTRISTRDTFALSRLNIGEPNFAVIVVNTYGARSLPRSQKSGAALIVGDIGGEPSGTAGP